MLFNSIEFLIFFTLVSFTYFIIPHRFRWMLLLAASCYFYMAFVPIYILILGFTIVIDYFAGILIENEQGKKRKLYLIMSLVANIGVLAIFKYYNFLNENLSLFLGLASVKNPMPYLSILLPIGLSFHTFQAMSYTIEVYRGNQRAERHFGIYSLYVMFYPQLVAGPIERPQNLLPQLRQKFNFNYARVVEGLKLILWGIFKKLVIADRLALYVNSVYNNASHHNGTTLFLATIFFSFQIYCDFSGYSDIAIGTARVMGFKLMTNFNRPYFAKNIAEFWKRWHISLSTWFKDYLYFSLGGSRVSIPRWYFNLFIVFLVSGLWHGANWTFIIWGAINGCYIIFSNISHPLQSRLSKIAWISKYRGISQCIQIISTFLMVSFAWIFFRANNISDAFLIIRKIFTRPGSLFFENSSMLIFSFAGIFFLLFAEIKKEYYKGKFSFLNNENWIVRYFSYATLIILILLMGVFDGGQFIYFQF